MPAPNRPHRDRRDRAVEARALAALLQTLSLVLYDPDGIYDLTGDFNARAQGAAAWTATNVAAYLAGEQLPWRGSLAEQIRGSHEGLVKSLTEFRAEQAAAGELGPKASRERYEAEKAAAADTATKGEGE